MDIWEERFLGTGNSKCKARDRTVLGILVAGAESEGERQRQSQREHGRPGPLGSARHPKDFGFHCEQNAGPLATF